MKEPFSSGDQRVSSPFFRTVQRQSLAQDDGAEQTAMTPDIQPVAGEIAPDDTATHEPEADGERTDSSAISDASSSRVATGPPAHVVEAVDVIDLSQFPWPAGTDGASDCRTEIFYQGPGSRESARQFYVDKLTADGWTDVTDQTRSGDARIYEKSGFLLSVNVPDYSLRKGEIQISLSNLGNYDVRRLPKPQGIENVMEPDFMSALYSTDQEVKEVETFCHDQFSQNGWHLYRKIEQTDHVRMDFVQNGVHVVASISRSQSPTSAGKSMIQYSVSMLRAELPIPQDAEISDFQDYPSARIKLTTPSNVPHTADFYDDAMRQLRWEPAGDHQVNSDSAKLSFRRGKNVAEILLVAQADGGTQVTGSTTYVPSDRAMQSQARAEKRDNDRRQQEQNDALAALKQAIPVAQFPLPSAANEVFRNKNGSANGGDIRFRIETDLAANLKFFRDKLTPDQWVEDQSKTHEDAEFGQLVFRKEKAWIKISLSDMSDGKGLQGMVEGTGLVAENDPRRDQSTTTATAEPQPAIPADQTVKQQMDAVRQQLIRQAKESGMSSQQLEQILKQFDSQLKQAEPQTDSKKQ